MANQPLSSESTTVLSYHLQSTVSKRHSVDIAVTALTFNFFPVRRKLEGRSTLVG